MLELNASFTSWRQLCQQQQATLSQHFTTGVPLNTLLLDHSQFTDQLLRAIWQQCGLDQEPGLQLIAIGGYGQQTLFPFSDIDVLIIYSNMTSGLRELLEQWVSHLWDCHLQLSQYVLDIAALSSKLQQDFIFFNATRHCRNITAHHVPELLNYSWPAIDYLEQRLNTVQQRHAKYWMTENSLHIKNMRGGIRDFQVLQMALEYLKMTDELSSYEQHFLLDTQLRLQELRYAIHLSYQCRIDYIEEPTLLRTPTWVSYRKMSLLNDLLNTRHQIISQIFTRLIQRVKTI